MNVVVGGMIRSGSTFSFNIVREVLAMSGPVETASASSIDPSIYSRPHDQHFVLKTHNPDESILNRIKDGRLPCVCTIRRPEDAVASWMRTFEFSLEHGIESVSRWLAWYVQVKDRVLTIDYHAIENRPREVIEQIVAHLGLRLEASLVDVLHARYDRAALKKRLDHLAKGDDTVDLGFSYYDSTTFFHRRHISDRADGFTGLSVEQKNRVRDSLSAYLGRDDFADLTRRLAS